MTAIEFAYLYELHKPIEAYKFIAPTMPAGVKLWTEKYKKLREMWLMSRFGIGYELFYEKQIQIRATDEEPADAQLVADGKVIDFQIVERQSEGRKRHKEYKEEAQASAKGEFLFKPFRSISEREASAWSLQTIKEKEAMKYSSNRPLSLLIYVNFNRENLGLRELCAEAKQLNVSSFNEIWLITSLISVHNDAFAIGRVFPTPDGFLRFKADSQEIMTEQEYREPIKGWVVK